MIVSPCASRNSAAIASAPTPSVFMRRSRAAFAEDGEASAVDEHDQQGAPEAAVRTERQASGDPVELDLAFSAAQVVREAACVDAEGVQALEVVTFARAGTGIDHDGRMVRLHHPGHVD